MLDLSFPFLLPGSKVRPADTRKNISLSIPGRFQTADKGICHLERSHFNICSSASFRRPFLVNYFSLLNQMASASGWVLNFFITIYNCLSSSYDFTTQRKTSSQAVIKLLNWKSSISTPFLSFSIQGDRTLRQLPFMFKWWYHLISCYKRNHSYLLSKRVANKKTQTKAM